MISSCYFWQKIFFFILDMAHADPFLVQIGPEKATFVEVLAIFFSRNYWIAREVININ